MPKTPRGKRVVDPTTDSFRVVNKAPNGEAQPYFDKSRNVWVTPWRKPDGRWANRLARLERSPSHRVIGILARSIFADSGHEVTEPVPVRIAGIDGVQIDVAVSGPQHDQYLCTFEESRTLTAVQSGGPGCGSSWSTIQARQRGSLRSRS